jgi:hypothetical protein
MSVILKEFIIHVINEARSRPWVIEFPPKFIDDVNATFNFKMRAQVVVLAHNIADARDNALKSFNVYTQGSPNSLKMQALIDRHGGATMRLTVKPASVPADLHRSMMKHLKLVTSAAASMDMDELHQAMDACIAWSRFAAEKWPAMQSIIASVGHELTAFINTASSGNDDVTSDALGELSSFIEDLGSKSSAS